MQPPFRQHDRESETIVIGDVDAMPFQSPVHCVHILVISFDVLELLL
jgi:hypothetical protein